MSILDENGAIWAKQERIRITPAEFSCDILFDFSIDIKPYI